MDLPSQKLTGDGRLNHRQTDAKAPMREDCNVQQVVSNDTDEVSRGTLMNGRTSSDESVHHRSKLPLPNHGVSIFPSCRDGISAIPRRSVSAEPPLSTRSAGLNHRMVREAKMDKPLPPRPILDYANNTSPSKCGRSLIDASERPLRISSRGNGKEWPTITPRSASAPTESPENTFNHDLMSSIPRLKTNQTRSQGSRIRRPEIPYYRSANALNATSSITASSSHSQSSTSSDFVVSETGEAFERKLKGSCSPLAYKSTGSGSIHRNREDSHCGEHGQRSLDPLDEPQHRSLRSRISCGNVVNTTFGSVDNFTRFTDFTKPTTPISRSNSPSSTHLPGSRLGSSKSTMFMSESHNNSTTSHQGMKSSRIPVPNSRKDSANTFKSFDSSPTSSSNCADGPVFGNRQLISADALRILDQGAKLSRPSRASSSESDLSLESSVKRLHIKRTPLSQRSNPTSPIGLSDQSLSTYGSNVFSYNTQQSITDENMQERTDYVTGQRWQDGLSQMFDEVDLSFTQLPPPSNSPFTEPLETIPSQAVFPAPFTTPVSRQSASRAASSLTAKSSNPSLSSSFISTTEQRKTFDEGLKATTDDSTDLSDGLVPETRKHLIRTLSMLEGHESPAKHDVDDYAVGQLLGHLNLQSNKTGKNMTPLSNNRGIDKVLAHNTAEADADGHDFIDIEGIHKVVKNLDEELPNEMASQNSTPQVVSKWSSSTPSSKHVSPPLDTSSRKFSSGSIPTRNGQSLPTMKPLPRKPLTSQNDSSVTFAPRQDGQPVSFVNTGRRRFPPRNSSLHPPKRNPGSVKAARERLGDRRHDGNRPAHPAKPSPPGHSTSMLKKASNEALQTPSALPYTQTKDRSKNEINPSSSGARTHGPSSNYKPNKSAQSSIQHSKSRTVLNKINGLFLTKREKKNNLTSIKAEPQTHGFVQNPVSSEVSLFVNSDGNGKSDPAQLPTTFDETFTATREPSGGTEASSSTVPRKMLKGGEAELALIGLAERMIDKAQEEGTSALRKNSLLTFAKIFSDTIIQAREAQIGYESAQAAARRAQIAYEMVQKSVDMLHNLGENVVKSFERH